MSDSPGDIPAIQYTRPPDPAAIFIRDLHAATPTAWVTPVLIVANVLVYVAMGLRGIGFTNPDASKMLSWGVNYGPLTTHGQYWRLFTAMFIHFGFLHIALNMFVLTQIGPLVERLLGNLRYLVAYILSGLCGSLLSVGMHPQTISAGASGAIFGLYGVLLGFLLIRRGIMPQSILKSLTYSAVIFIGYNIFAGTTDKHIDMSAHIGGLTSGFFFGMILSRQLITPTGPLRPIAIALISLGAIFFTARSLPKAVDIDGEIHDFALVDHDAAETFNRAIDALRAHQIQAPAVADLLEKKILPVYTAGRKRLQEQTASVPSPQRSQIDGFLAYSALRQRQWELLDKSIRDPDLVTSSATAHLATQSGEQADAIITKMNQSH